MINFGQALGALSAWAKDHAGEIGLAGGAASAGFQIAGGILGNRQGRINAKILERRGEEAYRAKLSDALQKVGTARARAAKGGGDPNVGSAADVIRQLSAEGRVAALREKFAFENEAAFAERRGQNALFEGILGGASTLLGASRRVDEVKGSGTPSTATGGFLGVPHTVPSGYWIDERI